MNDEHYYLSKQEHYFHGAALVHLGALEFFADSCDQHVTDERAGQVLCGFAFDAGVECASACNAEVRRNTDYIRWAEAPFGEGI